MGLFGNQAAQGGPPVDSVHQLRSQGKSDHEIIDLLSKQGYSSIDIYNVLNQADQMPSPPIPEASDPSWSNQEPSQSQQYPQTQGPLQGQQPQRSPQSQPAQDPWGPPAQDPWAPDVVQSAPDQYPEQPVQSQNDQPSEDAYRPPAQPTQQPFDQPNQTFGQNQPAQQFSPQRPSEQQSRSEPQSVFSGPSVTVGADSIDQIDQIAEAIIDEKWKQLKTYIEKIVDWKGKVETRIIAIEENQKNLNEQIIGLQKSLVDKVQTYDRHITDVGTEIKAMEKVFQKIIPSLTDNVNELSNVVHRMKDDR
jgi:hypothetical protein